VIWHAIAPNHSSFHLYGHSFGGILAYEYLQSCLSDDTHSQSIALGSITLPACRSVILSNTPTDLGQCNRDYDRLYAKNPLLFWKRHACRVGTPAPLQDAMNHAGSVWMGMDAVIDYQAAVPLHVTQRTKDSNNLVPFLVISCERDFAFETSNESSWKALLPSSNDQHRFVTLNGCAHYPFYEDKTAYSTILQEFLLPLDGHV
jgi:pimeloyl-ACP methyl ester carboxylesterase